MHRSLSRDHIYWISTFPTDCALTQQSRNMLFCFNIMGWITPSPCCQFFIHYLRETLAELLRLVYNPTQCYALLTDLQKFREVKEDQVTKLKDVEQHPWGDHLLEDVPELDKVIAALRETGIASIIFDPCRVNSQHSSFRAIHLTDLDTRLQELRFVPSDSEDIQTQSSSKWHQMRITLQNDGVYRVKKNATSEEFLTFHTTPFMHSMQYDIESDGDWKQMLGNALNERSCLPSLFTTWTITIDPDPMPGYKLDWESLSGIKLLWRRKAWGPIARNRVGLRPAR
jgi:hypothetical protein